MCNQPCENCSKVIATTSNLSDLIVRPQASVDGEELNGPELDPAVTVARALIAAVARGDKGLFSVTLANEPNGFPILTASWYFLPEHGAAAAAAIEGIGLVQDGTRSPATSWDADAEVGAPEDFTSSFTGGVAHLLKAFGNPRLSFKRMTRFHLEISTRTKEVVINRLWGNAAWNCRTDGFRFFRRG